MSKTVLQEIKDEMNSLKSGHNSWKQLVKFFESNEQIKPYYEEIVEECRRDNYFGMATMMIMTIEKLLEEIDDLKDEYDFVTDKKILKFSQGETINLTGKIVEINDDTKKEIE
jgi:hypothetical protein